MKHIFCFLLIILCGLSISCESPTQVDHTVVNDPPVVTITGNNSTLSLGDTLRLTLHAVDLTLTSGTVDFKDSTVIVFNNLKSVFDTTLIHIFSSVGTYNIIVSFTDGEKITTKQFNVAVSPNPSPVVTLIANKDTISLGDTLKVTLHAFDATLSSGSLDFNDGTIIKFFNMKHFIDTTITHIYSQLGTYSVTTTFNDGHTSTNVSVSIVTNRYFVLSFAVGMDWQYSYSFAYDMPPNHFDDQTGTKDWKIISFSVVNQDTIFTVRQIKNVARHLVDYPADTIYTIIDTSQFTIVQSYNSIKINLPVYWGTAVITEANNTYIYSYPIGNNGLTLDDRGLIRYSSIYTEYHLYITETLSLTSFTKP